MRRPQRPTDRRIHVKNEICERLGIEHPIFAFTHCRDVVVAVSKAGGIRVADIDLTRLMKERRS